MKRDSIVLTVGFVLLLSLAAVAAPCAPKTEHRKLNHAVIEATQRDKVNSGKELWRLDAPEVAKRECDTISKGSTAKQTKPGDKAETFSCTASAGGTPQYELTLQKPDWLLPYAGIYKMMMWVVTDVKTSCPAK